MVDEPTGTHEDASDGTATDGDADDGNTTDEEASGDGLSGDVIDRVTTLTRRAREAVDDNEREAYLDERESLLADHDYVPRVREEDTGETLVLYPEEWVDDGVVQLDRIEDTDRAVEASLSGVGDPDDWDAVAEHNRRVADEIEAEHGEPHGPTAHAFADFMSNHYAKRVEEATEGEREEFTAEYLPRNAWPTDEQLEAVAASLRLVERTGRELR
ncbi:DUF7108 family protein [Natronomonas amylolytica]|uniref:DUF7108 family protein n=1 Tax=Natronomonas amylolytica TaxID=3108498 RepID=UPI00300BABBA